MTDLHAYVRNPQKRWIAEFLVTRDGDRCQLCDPGVESVGPLEIDHKDGDPHNGSPDNLRLLCHAHNIAERNRMAGQGSMLPVSVVKARGNGHKFAPEWSSNEGLRHDYQRPKFSKWLYDSEIGVARGPGAIFHPKGLAKAAVHGMGLIQGKLGSSVTYERYLSEDLNGGFWLPCKDGSDMIERTAKPFPFLDLQSS